MSQLDAILKPMGLDPNNAHNKDAFACRKKLGLGTNECLNACTGAANGVCLATGCKCTAGFSGDDCSVPLPPPVAVAAAAPKALAAVVPAVVAPVAVAAGNCPDGSELDFYDKKYKPVSYDQCCVITGDDGIFDDDGDAKAVTTSTIKVCEDRAAPGKYCLFNAAKQSYNVQCTGDNTANDNVISDICKQGYNDNSPCVPAVATAPCGLARCARTTTDYKADVAATYEKAPCDGFPDVKIPAGEKRFFCIGLKGQHLLQCPDNIIKKCQTGCMSKFEMTGKACGKAACAAAKAAY